MLPSKHRSTVATSGGQPDAVRHHSDTPKNWLRIPKQGIDSYDLGVPILAGPVRVSLEQTLFFFPRRQILHFLVGQSQVFHLITTMTAQSPTVRGPGNRIQSQA